MEDAVDEAAEEAAPVLDEEDVAQGSAHIRGYVTDLDGRAIEGAEILLGISFKREKEIHAVSGADGSFEVSGLADEQFLIGAQHPDYAPAYVRAVASTLEGDSVTILLGHGGSLEGYVTHGGEPVSKCRIQVMHLDDSTSGQTNAQPDATGFYRVEALTPGAYYVEIRMENPAAPVDDKPRPVTRWRTIGAEVIIEEGGTTRGDFDFPAAASSLEGQILIDGVTPKKARITVRLINEDGDEERREADTDSDGYYRIGDLGFGNAQVQVRAENSEGRFFFSAARNVPIPEWEEAVLDIELLSGSRIAGRVSGVPEGFEAGVIVLPGNVVIGEVNLEVAFVLFQTATVNIDPMGGDEFFASGFEPGTYTVLLMAVKQDTSDPFGEIITGTYSVELEEGEEVFIEHSFD
jgi:hypothetical protein